MFGRRSFIAMASALGLSGCATMSSTDAAEFQAVVSWANTTADAISTDLALLPTVLPAAATMMNVTLPETQIASTTANITAGLAAFRAATAGLAASGSLDAGASYLKAAEAALNSIVVAAAALPFIPEPMHTNLVVASVALPPLEALLGLAVAKGTALAATIKAGKVTPAAPK